MESSFDTAPDIWGTDQEIDSWDLLPGDGSMGVLAGDDPSTSDFGAALLADLVAAARSPLVPSLFAQRKQDPEGSSCIHAFVFNSDQDRGVEHAATAINEHCSNGQPDSRLSGINCHYTRSDRAEAANSSQQVSSHSFNHRKDEPDRFRKM